MIPARVLLLLFVALIFLFHGSYSDTLVDPSRVKQISSKPRAFVYQGFLTDEECDHLITLAKSELKRSAVADNVSGKSKLSEVRTSSGMFIRKGKDPIISRIEDKIAAWTFLPKGYFLNPRFHYQEGFEFSDNIRSGVTKVIERLAPNVTFAIEATREIAQFRGKIGRFGDLTAQTAVGIMNPENGEDIQVLRYEHGEKYAPHHDYFSDKVNIARGGHRIATVLMYLTDVEKGGETVFPSAEENARHKSPAKDDLSDCAKKGIAVKPKKGDALLFFSLFLNAIPDEQSLHAGCPVIKGEKWSATKWIHVDSFEKNLMGSSTCVNENTQCERWAALGECTKNPEYMVGSASVPGACRQSCKVC